MKCSNKEGEKSFVVVRKWSRNKRVYILIYFSCLAKKVLEVQIPDQMDLVHSKGFGRNSG
jgi:hypothetical protein